MPLWILPSPDADGCNSRAAGSLIDRHRRVIGYGGPTPSQGFSDFLSDPRPLPSGVFFADWFRCLAIHATGSWFPYGAQTVCAQSSAAPSPSGGLTVADLLGGGQMSRADGQVVIDGQSPSDPTVYSPVAVTVGAPVDIEVQLADAAWRPNGTNWTIDQSTDPLLRSPRIQINAFIQRGAIDRVSTLYRSLYTPSNPYYSPSFSVAAATHSVQLDFEVYYDPGVATGPSQTHTGPAVRWRLLGVQVAPAGAVTRRPTVCPAGDPGCADPPAWMAELLPADEGAPVRALVAGMVEGIVTEAFQEAEPQMSAVFEDFLFERAGLGSTTRADRRVRALDVVEAVPALEATVSLGNSPCTHREGYVGLAAVIAHPDVASDLSPGFSQRAKQALAEVDLTELEALASTLASGATPDEVRRAVRDQIESRTELVVSFGLGSASSPLVSISSQPGYGAADLVGAITNANDILNALVPLWLPTLGNAVADGLFPAIEPSIGDQVGGPLDLSSQLAPGALQGLWLPVPSITLETAVAAGLVHDGDPDTAQGAPLSVGLFLSLLGSSPQLYLPLRGKYDEDQGSNGRLTATGLPNMVPAIGQRLLDDLGVVRAGWATRAAVERAILDPRCGTLQQDYMGRCNDTTFIAPVGPPSGGPGPGGAFWLIEPEAPPPSEWRPGRP